MSSSFRVSVDIGGTFTDCVVMDAQGHIVTGKSPTTPDDRSRGFFNSIERAADVAGGRPALVAGELLAPDPRDYHRHQCDRRAAWRSGRSARHARARRCDHVMKGTGRTAGLPVEQAPGRPPRPTSRPPSSRPSSSARFHRTHRRRRRPGRPARRGRGPQRSAGSGRAGVEALTISFLWSTINPAHERRAREIAQRGRAGPVRLVQLRTLLGSRSASSERTITAVMNSYIGPLMGRVRDSHPQDGAAERGFAGTAAVRAVRGRG